MHSRTILKLALVAVLAEGFACKGKETAVASPAGDSAQAVTAVVKTEKAPPPGAYVKKETYFKLPAAAGGEIDLANYAGKPVIVMFFSETCPYCRKAAPHLEALFQTYKGKGLAVIGISIEDNAEAPKRFAADLGTTFPMAYNGREPYKQYRAQGVPYIFLLNREHNVKTVWPGYTESFDAQLVSAVESVLAEK